MAAHGHELIHGHGSGLMAALDERAVRTPLDDAFHYAMTVCANEFARAQFRDVRDRVFYYFYNRATFDHHWNLARERAAEAFTRYRDEATRDAESVETRDAWARCSGARARRMFFDKVDRLLPADDRGRHLQGFYGRTFGAWALKLYKSRYDDPKLAAELKRQHARAVRRVRAKSRPPRF